MSGQSGRGRGEGEIRKSGRTRWVPAPPDRRESVLSGLLGGAVGLGAGLATWYVARTLMAREPVVQSLERPGGDATGSTGGSAGRRAIGSQSGSTGRRAIGPKGGSTDGSATG